MEGPIVVDKAPKLGEAQGPPANENKWAQNVKSYFNKQMAQSKQQQTTRSGQQSGQPYAAVVVA